MQFIYFNNYTFPYIVLHYFIAWPSSVQSLHFSILEQWNRAKDPDKFVLVQNFPYLMCASSRHRLWDRHWDDHVPHLFSHSTWTHYNSFRHQPIQSSLIKPLTRVYFGIASSPFSVLWSKVINTWVIFDNKFSLKVKKLL